MTKYIHWDEPGPNGENIHGKITVEEAIKRSKDWYNRQIGDLIPPLYTDEEALKDFLVVHWAWIKEES